MDTMAYARRTRVADVMTTEPITLVEHDGVHLAGLVLLREGIAAVPVVDDGGALVGVFSRTDVLSKFAAARQRGGALARLDDRHQLATTVGEACSRPAITIGPEATVDTAARELLDRDIGRLVVVEQGTVVGVISRSDVLKLFLPEWADSGPDDERRLAQETRDRAGHRSAIAPD